MNAIEIRNLTKKYDHFALQDLSLTLPSGCILGLVGENGAGKTTVIKLMLDMIRRDGGEIYLLGQESRRCSREDLGVILDEPGIPECLTAKQVGKIMAGIYRNWDSQTYDHSLERLAVPAGKTYKEFSRGMKMKLGIAIALSHDAKLLILDEPTNGLDPVVRDEVLDLFSEFTRDERHTILISSHIVSDLEKICDYIAFLHQGRLMLMEEKDVLCERYVMLHCTKEELESLDPAAIRGRKESPYGVKAIVLRDAIPAGLHMTPVSIEELFVFMVKEAGG